jgi:hypothetical protein
MRCPHCNAENRPGARFCGTCGEPLVVVEAPPALVTCFTCGASVKPGARFCPRCGTDLDPTAGAIPEDDSTDSTTEPALRLSGSSASRPTWDAPQGRSPEPVGGAARSPGSPAGRPSWVEPDGWAPEPVPGAGQPPGGPAVRPPWEPPAGRFVEPVGSGVQPASGPADLSPWEAADQAPTRRRPAWPLAIVMVLLSGVCSLCAMVALAAAPAFSGQIRPLPVVDPTRPDLTILVEESYINDMVREAMPAALGGDAQLDVQPDSRIVVTMDFSLVIIRLEVAIHIRIGVEDGHVRASVESIETGGMDLLDLVGTDQITLGEQFTGAIQKVLEDELGPGARLLTLTTDESRVILTARWE